MPSSVLNVPLPASRFSYELPPNVPNKIPRNLPSSSFASILIALLSPFINKPDPSRDIITFMISLISSLEIINGVLPDPNIFLRITASVAAATAINPYGIKTLLANGLSTFPINDNPVFNNGTKSLPKNPLDCHILYNSVFDNFTLARELFAKALPSFEICVLVNNNLCRKLFSSLESQTTFDESFKVTPVPFFIPDFNLLRGEFDNLTFKMLY